MDERGTVNDQSSGSVAAVHVTLPTPSANDPGPSSMLEMTTPLLQEMSNNNTSSDNTSSNHRALPMSALRFTRDIIERRTSEHTRNWRDNLSNVFMEIRPLVQQAQSVNNSNLLSSWITSSGINNRNVAPNVGRQNSHESVIINFDGSTGGGAAAAAGVSNSHHLPLFQQHREQEHGGSSTQPPFQYQNYYHNHSNMHPHHPYPSNSSNSIGPHQAHAYNSNNHNNMSDNVNNSSNNINLNNVSGPGINGDGNINNYDNNGNNGGRNNPHNPHHHHHHHHHHHENGNGNGENEGPVTEALAQIPEARAILSTLNRYTPYVCILLAKSCYDHLDGILDFFALFITFSHANWVVRQEITKQHQKRALPLLRELVYIVLVISIIGFMLEKKSIFISLIFTTTFSEPFTLRNLLFSVGITDLILKLITVAIKILITLLPPTIIEYKGRGRIYLMAESVSQLYRALAPIQPWLVYLMDSYQGSEKVMGVILSAAYMVAKGTDLLNRAKFCKKSFIKLLQKVSFGLTPSKEQLQTAGGQCPICHDEFNCPVVLECNHIFCESCVGTWFDREQTCPLCRAKVVDDPSWRDGSTTFFVQFY